MGRMEAAGSFDRKTGECKRPGKITPEMMSTSVAAARVELRGAGLNESPQFYKRLPDVLEAHSRKHRFLHRVTPVAQPGPPVPNDLEERMGSPLLCATGPT